MKARKEIPLFKVFMSKLAQKNVKKVLDSGYIGQGPSVDLLEEKLKRNFNFPNVLTLNSGTSAIHLAIHLLKDKYKEYFVMADGLQVVCKNINWGGLELGDTVLTTALTCTATNWPILANNLKIKWVDIDPNTLNMSLDDLEKKLNKDSGLIVIVNWGGYPVDRIKLYEIVDRHYEKYGKSLAIIHDCAHSFGSKYFNEYLGEYSVIKNDKCLEFFAYSFQAIKHFTTVDGGGLVCPNQSYLNRAKLIRWYGIDRNSNRKDFRCELPIEEWGFKFHMNDVNASVGLANLEESLNFVVAKHKENGNFYNNNLKNIPGVTLLENKEGFDSSYWVYTIKVDNQDDFFTKMKSKNIVVSRVHERNDIHPCVSSFRSDLPELDKIVKQMVCIPAGWWVSSEDRDYILNSIKEGW